MLCGIEVKPCSGPSIRCIADPTITTAITTDARTQFENPECPQQSQGPNHGHALRPRQQHHQIGWQNRQQIDQPEEAEHIAQRFRRADDSHHVLDREQQCDAPFGADQQSGVRLANRLDAFQHHDQHTQEDGD
jgi:hypothetical protein